MKNRIRELREQRGWTQADLARELDISRQTVNALEGGRWDPSLALAFAIAELFGERLETMFTPSATPRLRRLAAEVATREGLDDRSAEDIVAYDRDGLTR